MTPEIVVSLDDPRHPDAMRMLVDGDTFYRDNYPPESNHLFSVDDLRFPNVRFFIARYESKAVGIGALVLEKNYGELKRMWVDAPMRRFGVGAALLSAIEAQARLVDIARLRLETGVNQLDAISFYSKNGFDFIGAFGHYEPDPLSVFMEKLLP